MKPLYAFILSFVVTCALPAQEFRLITDYEHDIPVENPYGLAFYEGYFWITDVKSGEIYGVHPELDNIYRVEAPRKNITGITFEGRYMWVLVDAWDTIAYPHHNLPKTQAYKMDPWTGEVLDSVMVPYYNVPEVTERFMYGIAWYDSALYASFNGGYGPSMCRIDKDGFTNLCCAHPSGMEVINGKLWSVHNQGYIYTLDADGTCTGAAPGDYVITDDGDSLITDPSGNPIIYAGYTLITDNSGDTIILEIGDTVITVNGDIIITEIGDTVITASGDTLIVDTTGSPIITDPVDPIKVEPPIEGFREVNIVLPVIIDDSGSYDDWSMAMEFDFYATDLAWDGSNIWLLDPVERKIKKMVRDSLLPEPPPDTLYAPFWIEWLEVIPAQPTVTDEIKIVSHTGFSSGGCELAESEINYDEAGNLFISAAHDIGMLTYICSSSDTFNLGKLDQGYHEVYYELSASNMMVHSVSQTIRFYVRDTLPLNSYIEIIPEIPAAGQEVKIVVHGICYINTLFDLLNNHIILHAFYGSCIMAPCGIDTLSLGILGEDSYTLDYYLYDICMPDPDIDSLVYYENVKFDVEDLSGTTSIAGETGQEISVYPNPSADQLFVRLPAQNTDAELGLYSVSGQLMLSDVIGPGTELFRVDLSDVAAGYYILRVSSDSGVYTERISVIK